MYKFTGFHRSRSSVHSRGKKFGNYRALGRESHVLALLKAHTRPSHALRPMKSGYKESTISAFQSHDVAGHKKYHNSLQVFAFTQSERENQSMT